MITRELPNCTSNTGEYRKPPAAASRFSRGGKTTFLRCLNSRLVTESISPICVNLNGTFRLRDGETLLGALGRGIADALCPSLTTETLPYDLECKMDELKTFIDGRAEQIVLLVDELNALGHPLSKDVSQFLKCTFLDPSNRYLVFTTHVPLSIDGPFQ
jgi:hypothetical protein